MKTRATLTLLVLNASSASDVVAVKLFRKPTKFHDLFFQSTRKCPRGDQVAPSFGTGDLHTV